MIFVGEGALLRRAVTHAATRGHPVDLVCSADPLDAAAADAPHLAAADINAHAGTLARACTDGIVWSLNNRQIFREPLLRVDGLRILNIHNGLLPRHRGLPSVAVLFALLHGDTEYGVTVHEVDAGIDTGPVLAEHRFPVGPEDRYHEVMLRGIRACHALFEQILPAVAAGTAHPARAAAAEPSAYYGLRALDRLGAYRDHPAYARATDLGPFAAHAHEFTRALLRLSSPASTPGGPPAGSACSLPTTASAPVRPPSPRGLDPRPGS
ncbi:formyltransferase family protein [Streptomyces sp. NBC_00190]|uniref:formyltransferase family protein n=1 Tax=unclassified Streptomyces TaxID=2593676 RepID=UPI002E2C1BA5|nr:formyltransferase family protein [Streptomyces sp. NBC_00190]WSZ37705.1 formyltransferase family protein [Streptomyces sp. NBC_00868]